MILAVDIGSSKTLIALLDKKGKITKLSSLATVDQALKCTELIIATILAEFDVKNIQKIAIAVPGVVKNNKVAWCSNLSPDWQNFDIIKEFKKTFNVDIKLENDANLAGISEISHLQNKPKSAIYLNIGAGIGSGFIIDGKLIPGLLNSEAGMTMLEYDGIIREWEKFASGRAIRETYDRPASEITSIGAWQSIADRISRGLLVLIPIIQPEIIIIGGIMGNYFSKYSQHLNNLIDEKLPLELDRPKIIAAKEPDEAVINGCFQLATQDVYLKI